MTICSGSTPSALLDVTTDTRMAVFAFIEGFYNPRRRHSTLGYLSPAEYEARACTRAA